MSSNIPVLQDNSISPIGEEITKDPVTTLNRALDRLQDEDELLYSVMLSYAQSFENKEIEEAVMGGIGFFYQLISTQNDTNNLESLFAIDEEDDTEDPCFGEDI